MVWMGVTKEGPVTDKGVYEMAKEFSQRLGKGEIEAKHSSEEKTTSNNY